MNSLTTHRLLKYFPLSDTLSATADDPRPPAGSVDSGSSPEMSGPPPVRLIAIRGVDVERFDPTEPLIDAEFVGPSNDP
ncbi:hypothetical protein [Salinigranum rubrum]|uniref:hypothetical protein n=1 Tax=Salinigranum rubrum TaxID=755307 RepID=UPI0013A5B336|nr:hypothetical protein [Salinigranum rubrum]